MAEETEVSGDCELSEVTWPVGNRTRSLTSKCRLLSQSGQPGGARSVWRCRGEEGSLFNAEAQQPEPLVPGGPTHISWGCCFELAWISMLQQLQRTHSKNLSQFAPPHDQTAKGKDEGGREGGRKAMALSHFESPTLHTRARTAAAVVLMEAQTRFL